ncbi:MAG: CCA tRNA nucleotidyltransferase [Candidatus Blackburnbacteria bacterium]|nr:CCA tRNA nucleotidyltransferase [Candidatus Blackburnbacteria bacterium]
MQIDFPPFVKKILHTFERSGYQIYIVGGVVRDLMLNRKTNDWDFTTDATPEQILNLFPDGFYNNQFGTVGITKEGEEKPYEITTFRTEHGYSDKRRPDTVTWGKDLEEDLSRRDFTINAMAIPANKKIIDPFGGHEDIKKKLIRAVGNPIDRFSEDALRMMRAIRIAAELGFAIEENTFQAIKMHSENIKHVSWERIRDELFKILKSDFPDEGITMLYASGLLTYILPELVAGIGVEQKSPQRHHVFDVYTHCLNALKNCPSKNPLVRLATLLHDIGKVQTRKLTPKGIVTFYNHEIIGSRQVKEIADRLRLSKKQKDKLWILVRWHQFSVDDQQTDSALRRFIKNVGVENLQDMLDLRVGDRLGGGVQETSWRLEKFKKRLEEVQHQPFSVKDLKVDGRDVMEILKIPSGPKVGEILQKLFEEVEEDQTKNEREHLLARIQEFK